MNHETLLITFIAVTALAVVTQGVAAMVMAFAVLDIRKHVNQILDETRQHIHPLIKSTHGLVEDVAPRIRVIGDNLVEVSERVKTQAAHVNIAFDDILMRTTRQAARAEQVTSSAFDAVESTRSRVEKIVDAPLRIATGIASGVMAGVEQLFSVRSRKPSRPYDAPRAYQAQQPEVEEVIVIVEEPLAANDLQE